MHDPHFYQGELAKHCSSFRLRVVGNLGPTLLRTTVVPVNEYVVDKLHVLINLDSGSHLPVESFSGMGVDGRSARLGTTLVHALILLMVWLYVIAPIWTGRRLSFLPLLLGLAIRGG